MNTLHFKYAVEVEKTGSISQAAENLFMAQPNLSKAIKELEDTLGIVIFKRKSKGVTPTAQGKEFLKYAKRILVQLDKMESIYIPTKELEKSQQLKVSMPRGSYISAGFAQFVSELNMNEDINITIEETNSLKTIANVADNGFNMGIIRYQTSYENYFMDYLKEKSLSYEPIWEFSCLALMPEEHPLAKAERIYEEELKKISIEIVHGDNTIPYLSTPEIKHSCDEKSGCNKRIYVFERGSQLELLGAVKNTFMWVSPIPQSLLSRYNLVQRKCINAEYMFKDVLIYPHDYKFSVVDKLFLNKLYETKNEVAFNEYR